MGGCQGSIARLHRRLLWGGGGVVKGALQDCTEGFYGGLSREHCKTVQRADMGGGGGTSVKGALQDCTEGFYGGSVKGALQDCTEGIYN